ncbi:Gfo/Idh/MocA family oxidoreductase [Oerskovia turbata]|uniref:Gfo/Idh/MocA family oxidoreductase n=1 Tax=Oerskovia turbata TaxID=1713 RepID=A0A4Q1KW87_9CELL|nr:Gfo/Idh/MocA family oxidoreductase [Oerskovia turbata]RXR26739.1 Gfo/Idh/MocA family oxidoreductase [Oerskovia turbata]RXR34472.1 Gfo/Idh/MocA family oxidoreductase [Oerskovia turbata]TGJ97750.1 gfo/Idh/MocA family oxidoreductase [Actinotalea fermentans ATCC 43279 = JCM 9966 = DSM 3133]
MADLKAGLIGVGAMGRHHARVLRELPGVDLVAIADPGGDPYGVAGELEVLRDVDELIAAGIDMAVVAVPTRFHEEVGLALAAAGVHAMVEKPIAENGEAGARVAQAFKDAGLVGCVGHIERFNPALQEMRRRMEAGELGEVYQIATRRQGPFPARIADVGVVKDLGTHDIDLTAWVAQSPYASITAKTAHRSGRPHEDMVLATGQLQNGVIVNHIVNWLSPMKERLTMVTGERGAYVADTASADLTFYANGVIPTEWESITAFRGVSEGDIIRYAIAKREPLRVEHEAFRDAVLGVSNDVVTMEEGLRTLKVAEAVLDSAARGVTVEL